MTTKTAGAALILTLIPCALPASPVAEPPIPSVSIRPEASVSLRDDALAHAVLDQLPPSTTEPAPELEISPTEEGSTTYGDPYGFAAFLNGFRASAGLAPLAYDENLSAWASQNNAAQCSMGLGHHILMNFSQNSGYNQHSVLAIAQSWMSSPAHAQNMLTPAATRFGIAYGPGPYWTLNLQ